MRHAQRPALCASAKCLLIVTVLFVLAVLTGLLLNDHKIENPANSQHLRAKVHFHENLQHQNPYQGFKGDNTGLAIPKILHHVYLDGLHSLQQAESTAGPQPGARFPGYNSTLRRSCPQVHQDWQYIFWNISQAEHLVSAIYPGFLKTFESYQTNVQRGASYSDLLCVTLCCSASGPFYSITNCLTLQVMR